jgi:undecaprenyl-diphosphatase
MDTSLFNFINHLPHNSVLDFLALALHYATREGLIYLPLFIYLFLSQNVKERTLAKQGLLAGLLTYGLNDMILKNLLDRVRPFETLNDVIYLAPAPTSFSFPSGQAAVAFAVATLWWLFFPRKLSSYCLFIFALVVGLDRVYMGHHYPSDVLVGGLIGAVISYVIFKLMIFKK